MARPSVEAAHQQFVRQARWTQGTRSQLYRRARLLQAERVLDVGCGTGAVTSEVASRTRGHVTGVDIDADALAFARQHDDRSLYEYGDAHHLPYPDDQYDLVLCHFALLWIGDPPQALREMARVLRPAGRVLVCAEPDYGGRLDWPDLPIRVWQTEGLRRQGAHPTIGRELRHLLVAAGFDAEVGVMPSLWDTQSLRAEFEAEWTMLASDVGDAVDPRTFAAAKARADEAIADGTRLVYMPVFYALGRVV
ncbi:MAG: methyltransferase domain-containing protein [Anaerolineae bacterium]|nr:methyltransferase domain-containing protein [Anaerolineae bacterium]